MIIIDAETGTLALQVVGDPSPDAPSFDISISATATVVIYQGNRPDAMKAVATVTAEGAYNGAAVMDFMGAEITANTGTVSVTVANKRF